MLYCNGNFIGGLFDEELCFVYADSVSELLGHPEPVYRGYSSTAQHRMLVIPEEHWSKALKLLYAEKFDWSRLVYDIMDSITTPEGDIIHASSLKWQMQDNVLHVLVAVSYTHLDVYKRQLLYLCGKP